ncbi:hypothetical protein AMTRI_Chr05g57820 [Amborella trichopoda]|uniref:uncharacterized protein LOC18443376 isoform X1 n=1 Tax=Amborella trichopoda TaxID=13333 RepID=UPI0005D44670|nr:uncharacterized protein LOC18443376 isoform X1 [Amborella trichopoda]XP_020528741.1 uncharacterized protein LOC18443376 isoform X1 [Amborella trichopoda]XP_020528742.1 uncharacterized protein LOC18443376 isoform X1 [Amborella trichopoda]XP_020528743.1 uncharacterized protein LOC18443376 isoform X1 [Amborella trichopoda]XP_020528744.1 uncharacterized protein LOC18443376 isoform X1 [Amborella trichopoda]XP_020528746.1 uncharacterized protein LOC18443376 isoform X1 [Amborella trichopoda]XP_02|eukprot:XP_011626798.1 uncharacterized protein LOC18443376 isoform X1 [Amborella trichopoda]
MECACSSKDISTTTSIVGFASSDYGLNEKLANERNYEVHVNDVINSKGLSILPSPSSSIDESSSCLAAVSSYLGQRFSNFIVDTVYRDLGKTGQEPAPALSGQHARTLCNEYESKAGCSISSGINGSSRSSPPVSERTQSNHRYYSSVNTNGQIVESTRNFWSDPSIFQGLMFPFFGFRFAWKLAFACLKCSFIHVRRTHNRVRSLISRVQKTLRGSTDDIGWLQRMAGMPPVVDGTDRFMELLDGIRNGEHKLPNSFVYLLIPGLFSNHSPLYFVNTKRFFSKMGLACHIAKIHSEASVEHNALELKQYIEELYWGSGKRVLLLGHSKGGVDAAAALSLYWSELKDKVAGLALVQSPYGGSPIASDILREGQIADVETRRLMELVICKLIKGDMQALEDLTYDKRKDFILKHTLPTDVPLVSFHTEVSIAPSVLATMSHIAHAELPSLPLPLPGLGLGFNKREEFDGSYEEPKPMKKRLPVVIPLAAAMAASSLHLHLRYGEASDGLVTRRDAEVPGSVVVRPERKLDHAWMVYSSWRRKKDEGLEVEGGSEEMCEALLSLLVEIGQGSLNG